MARQLIDRSQRAQQVFGLRKDVQALLKDGNCLPMRLLLHVELSKVMVSGQMMGIPANGFSKAPLRVLISAEFGQRCAHHIQSFGISLVLRLSLQNAQAFRESALAEVVSGKLQFPTGVFRASEPACGETDRNSRDNRSRKALGQGMASIRHRTIAQLVTVEMPNVKELRAPISACGFRL